LYPVLISIDLLAQVAGEVKFFHRAYERKEAVIFRWSYFEDYGTRHGRDVILCSYFNILSYKKGYAPITDLPEGEDIQEAKSLSVETFFSSGGTMKKIIFLTLLISLFIVPAAYAQSARDTVKALKRIEARADMGISYSEYVLAVADARVEVQMYLESHEAKQKAELTSLIKRILWHYETAREIWKNKVSRTQDLGTVFGHLICLNNDPEGVLGRRLLKQYPQADKPVDQGGALAQRAYKKDECEEVHVDNLIHIIWQEASKDLLRANKMLFM
jgi:hypothetical protein